ncbi:MAG: Gfo/Idh/MocA family oxidoreductase [candidate division KSB1 bacterium]|nr:Gfo/Idh/MocA family oxidoreductase [candidate division KSB1 bacterium]MDZ7275990.1 Gfo/Idh/MocA family oxidoreductase [candidate division KSB1 bacterium]MDZ7285728.1 Gfo/Idh/MocA family oxidoreductase [candidate division KSB1 bacterium]MDZ7298760.1 Gfo/Idh/MocA family oxidoreductase [candidate division KSB1 bacterium]MDZ7305943.1 Gfo/Idh/MocA family oxidoreductase [candidate division KSB1 bacterium]
MLNVAVVGIGKMGLLHAGIMNALQGVRLCAIVDTSKFLLGFAQSLKQEVEIYEDFQKMLDQSKPDAAVLATPVFLHVPMANACLQRGIPFFLEKPLSLTSREAEALVAGVEKRGLTTMVGYMMRYVETFAKAKQLLQSGALGELITFQATIYVSQLFKTGKGWRYNKQESGGGVVIGQATHLIDLLRWYFGPVSRVSAHTRNWYSREVEDFAHAHFEFASGLTGWFDSSWSVRHHRLLEVSLTVHAANGNLIVCDDYVKLYLDKAAAGFPAGWTNFMKPDLFEGVEIDLGGPQYTRQDSAFVAAVKNGTRLESDVRNAYEVQRIVDAIYASAAGHGAPVSL